jgi:hypothetical protein
MQARNVDPAAGVRRKASVESLFAEHVVGCVVVLRAFGFAALWYVRRHGTLVDSVSVRIHFSHKVVRAQQDKLVDRTQVEAPRKGGV